MYNNVFKSNVRTTYHFILCQSSCFITQQVTDPTQLLWNGSVPDHGIGDVTVLVDTDTVPDL